MVIETDEERKARLKMIHAAQVGPGGRNKSKKDWIRFGIEISFKEMSSLAL